MIESILNEEVYMPNLIYDKAAWKINDKEWMASRKSQWKEVVKTLKLLHANQKKDIPIIKQFFFTGDVSIELLMETYWRDEDEVDNNLPFKFQTTSISELLELWLTEDLREENLSSIVHKYDKNKLANSRHEFLDILQVFPKNGSIYFGREEMICKYLSPARCRRDDYPNDELYKSCALEVHGIVVTRVLEFLRAKHPNPHHYGRLLLDDWKENLIPALECDSEFTLYCIEQITSEAYSIVTKPKNKTPLVLEVSRYILALLSNERLPKPILKTIARVTEKE